MYVRLYRSNGLKKALISGPLAISKEILDPPNVRRRIFTAKGKKGRPRARIEYKFGKSDLGSKTRKSEMRNFGRIYPFRKFPDGYDLFKLTR